MSDRARAGHHRLCTALLLIGVVAVAVVGMAGIRPTPRGGRGPRVAPPSRVYPPDPRQWLALSVPGSHAVKGARGRVAQVIELRGWLTFVGTHCYGASHTPGASPVNDREPDWPYNLQLDPTWLDHLGLRDPNRLIRAGNVVNFPLPASPPADGSPRGIGPSRTPSRWALVSAPIVHIEVTSWDPERHPGQQPPRGWRSLGPLPGACASDVLWPYDPRNPVPGQPRLAVGQYVRVVGSLVTDQPHTAVGAAAEQPDDVPDNGFADVEVPEVMEMRRLWELGRGERDPRNLARWTEVHPPDTVSVMAPRDTSVTMRSVLVGPSPDAPVGSPATLDAVIVPPRPKPRPDATIQVEEIVGPGTRWRRATPARMRDRARRFDVLADRVVLHIAVGGGPKLQNPLSFQAVYRVSWH